MSGPEGWGCALPLVRDGAIQWFLTPFRDDIWNRRQVSVGDRGGPSHTTQKSSGIGPPGTPNELVCDRARHRNPIIFLGMYIPHGES